MQVGPCESNITGLFACACVNEYFAVTMDIMDWVLTPELILVPPLSENQSPPTIVTEYIFDQSPPTIVTEPSSSLNENKRRKKSASLEVNSSKPIIKDQKMHRSIFEEGGIADGIPVFYMIKEKKTLKGYKQGRRIFCTCCNDVISASQFEAHAGQARRRKPYDNIFVNGMSLHAYVSHFKVTGQHMALINDDVCEVCDEVENNKDFVLCSGCPRHFHIACISETWAPLKEWFCKHCQVSKHLQPISDNAAGGNNLIEVATKRCIPIIDNQNKHDLVACSICRSHDFSVLSIDGFNDKTVIVCEQCELEFHIGCLRTHFKADLKALPPDSWFCSFECGILKYALKVLVAFGPQKVPAFMFCNSGTIYDAEWRIVHGKRASEGNKSLLDEAANIFKVGFNPIIDEKTRKDMITAMTYGTKIDGSDFAGMHCAILTIGSKVVTAGLFRVFGHEVAELPIVATGQDYKGKGYFRVFFRCFEKLLSHLKVKKLVLPAAEEAIAMWTKFGLRNVTRMEQNEYSQKHTSMVDFTGTRLLEKEVPEGQHTFDNEPFFNLNMA